MPVLDVRELVKVFNDRDAPAVDGVTFSVPSGTFTTLLGPSGCGKSTTLRLIAGLETPDSGEVELGGTVLASGARRLTVPIEDRDIGFVFQSYALWPHMTVFDHVAYPLRVRRDKANLTERVERTLATVRLERFASRYPGELSGGQQQRVALARALVFEPSVVLMDEPLSNLDAELRGRMREELRDLQQKLGITAIYVTHDQLEALSLSDQVIVMKDGHVIEAGDPQSIFERPKSEFTAQFVAAANILEGTIAGREEWGWLVALGGGSQLAVGRSGTENGLGAGEKVKLAVRPELVIVGGEATDETSSSRLGGEVKHASYYGSFTDVTVTTTAGEIRSRLTAATSLQPGERVTLSIPRTAARIVVSTEASMGAPDTAKGTEERGN